MLPSVRLNESMGQTRLHVNKELCKKAKYDAQKLIAGKKQEFFIKNSQEDLAYQKNYETLSNLFVCPRKRLFQFPMQLLITND